MDVRDLTPIEIADLLDEAWLADLGNGEAGPDEATRAALARSAGAATRTCAPKPGPRGGIN